MSGGLGGGVVKHMWLKGRGGQGVRWFSQQQKEEISPQSCSAVYSQMWAEGLGSVSMSLPVLKERGGKTDEDMPATDQET